MPAWRCGLQNSVVHEIDADVVVEPVRRRAGDRRLRVVLELVEDRDRRIAGALRRLGADQLVGAEVGSREVVVVVAAVRPQMNARERVVRDVAGDVRPRDDRLHVRTRLRLRERERPGAVLLALGFPFDREVAVQVEALVRRRDLDLDAVVVPDQPLPEQPVERAVLGPLVRVARRQQARIVRVRLPGSVRVLETHHQDPPVAVEVLLVQPVLLVEPRIRPNARADEARLVRERRLGAVRGQPRHDVEDARVEAARHLGIAPVAAQELVEQVQRRRAAGHLERVDVRLDEEAGLVEVGSGLEVRDGRQPDVAVLVGLADALDAEELRLLLGPALEDLGQLVVPVEPVECDVRHPRSLSRQL